MNELECFCSIVSGVSPSVNFLEAEDTYHPRAEKRRLKLAYPRLFDDEGGKLQWRPQGSVGSFGR